MLASYNLPGQRDGRRVRTRLFTFNVVVTGMCNAHCTYCHYYSRRDRKDIEFHLDVDQFVTYMHFVKLWSTSIPGETRYRFSGGDPMTLKDKLFEYAAIATSIVGKSPFMLTAGKALSVNWLEKAKRSALSHACISIENPFDPDPGAPDPFRLVDFIRKYNSDDFPLIAGVCVVSPSQYKNIDKIADWFFDSLGHIPVLHEVNYDSYVSPSEQEWHDLESSITRVLQKYAHRTPLILFPSVSPELAFGGGDAYVFDLDLENMYGMTRDNLSDCMEKMAARLRNDYPALNCLNKECPWWDGCDNIKWFWGGERQNSRERKLIDYCRFKRVLNDAYYISLVDNAHTSTTQSIITEDPLVLPIVCREQ